MTRPDDEFPPLDVTSTLNLGGLDEALEGPDADVVPGRVAGSLPPGMALLVGAPRSERGRAVPAGP